MEQNNNTENLSNSDESSFPMQAVAIPEISSDLSDNGAMKKDADTEGSENIVRQNDEGK